LLDLSNTISECRRAYNAMSAAQQRLAAATKYREAAYDRVEANKIQYDVLLEAQRRILEAQLQFINAEVEYAIAIKNVHFERGTFLHYHGIGLSESQSDAKANSDYQRRRSLLNKPMNYVMQDASIGLASGSPQTGSGCSQCGATSSSCGCATGTPSLSTQVAQSVNFGNPIAGAGEMTASPAEPAESAKAEETDLPARGLGKKHVYQPKFLPPPTTPQ